MYCIEWDMKDNLAGCQLMRMRSAADILPGARPHLDLVGVKDELVLQRCMDSWSIAGLGFLRIPKLWPVD